MISLINYDFQWGRSEVVIIYPDVCIYNYGDPHFLRQTQVNEEQMCSVPTDYIYISHEGIHGVMRHYWIAGPSACKEYIRNKLKSNQNHMAMGQKNVKPSILHFLHLKHPKNEENRWTLSSLGPIRDVCWPSQIPPGVSEICWWSWGSNTTVVSNGPISTVHCIGTEG